MMYCNNCGTELQEGAKFCNNCGIPVAEKNDKAPRTAPYPQKKKKKHPILGTILLIFGILLVIGVIFGDSNDASTKSSNPTDNTSNITETSTDEIIEIFTVGDTAEKNNVLVTLNDVRENAGSSFFAPTEGNVFVICEFTIENNTSSDLSISSIMSFESYFDDYGKNISMQAMAVDQSSNQLDGTIAPGKKLNGIVAYEVPADWKEVEIRFSPSIFTTNPFIFTYSK